MTRTLRAEAERLIRAEVERTGLARALERP